MATTAAPTTSNPTAAGAPTPTPTQPTGSRFIAVYRHQQASDQVEILTRQGSVVAKADVDRAHVPDSGPVGWGHTGVFLYDVTTRELTRLTVDGRSEPLASLDTTPAGVAESPDGQSWVYSLVTWDNGSQSSTSSGVCGPIATSRIYLGSTSGAPRLLATLSRPNAVCATHGQYLGGYRVQRWDTAGVLLGSAPTNVGGAGPFIGEGYGLSTVVRLDPVTGAVSAPLTSSSCRFSDVAGDGTMACVAGHTIKVVSPSGSTRTIDAGADWVGEVAFTGESSSLTFCTAIFPQGESSDLGWFDHLFVVHLDAAEPAPRELSPADGWRLSETYAFDSVLDRTTLALAVSTRNVDHSSVELVDLATGRITVVSPLDLGGDSIIGTP